MREDPLFWVIFLAPFVAAALLLAFGVVA